MEQIKKLLILGIICLFLFSGVVQALEETGDGINEKFRTVVDSRGVKVTIPVDIERVATISDGLVEEMMSIFGVDDKIVSLGSKGTLFTGDYVYPVENGPNVTISGGKNIALVLSPGLKDLPLFADYGSALNLESLATSNPELVIIRLGDSTYQSCKDEIAQKSIERIESLGIPVVVLNSPNCEDNSDPTKISDEIRILGRVFGQEEKAEHVVSAIESAKDMIQDRTKDIRDDQKKPVLLLGLSAMHRTETAAGISWGRKSPESYMIEKIVNAKNAFQSDMNGFQVISYEQIMATDPDVIILGTASGYHPPSELYSSPYYRTLNDLSAVQKGDVVSLPYEPRNAARRLEFPIDLMVIAKATYPELFDDIDLKDWTMTFYKDVFGVDSDLAEELWSSELMDWSQEEKST